MKFIVRSIAMDRETRKFLKERTEYIDSSNPMFSSALAHEGLSPQLVEAIYQVFWNIPSSSEEVKVIGVERV